jgi:5,10-methylenetetrahydromethanopterin reductase
VGVAFDLGIVPREPAPDVVELCVEAERLGFGGLWVADSQSIFRDAYALLGAAAVRTSHVLLSTGVTNPVTRHPAVIAGAFATLAELAPGRAVLTFGRGESAVRTLGLRPATTQRMEETVHALRALLAGETTVWEGREIRMAWTGPPVPVYVAASGPRTLQLAGRVADGVLFQVGADPRLVQWALEQVAAGAREAGRSRDDLVLCARVGCSVDDDRERAREEMKPYAAVAVKTSFDAIPDDELPADLLAEAQELRERYDYYEHAHGAARHRHLVTERVMDAVSIAGTPEEAAARLRELAALGVDRIVAPVVVSDGRRLARTLAERLLPALELSSAGT